MPGNFRVYTCKNNNKNVYHLFKYQLKTNTQLRGNSPENKITPCRNFIIVKWTMSVNSLLKGESQDEGGLFICFNMTAIYLEFVNNKIFTTDYFIDALRRFISKRETSSYIILC